MTQIRQLGNNQDN